MVASSTHKDRLGADLPSASWLKKKSRKREAADIAHRDGILSAGVLASIEEWPTSVDVM